jgi:hypothetical protein
MRRKVACAAEESLPAARIFLEAIADFLPVQVAG